MEFLLKGGGCEGPDFALVWVYLVSPFVLFVVVFNFDLHWERIHAQLKC